MKSALLVSSGALLIAITGCGSSTPGTPGSGGAGTGSGGATTGSGGAGTGSGGATTGSGGSTTGSGGATTGSGGATTGSGGAGTGSGGAGTSSGGATGSGGAGTASGGAGGAATGSGGRGGGAAGAGMGGQGTGGRGTGGGTAGAGVGGAAAPLTITSTQFGAFDNAFMVTPCMSAGTGYDCPNLPMGMTSCPTAAWTYPGATGTVTTTEGTGNTYTETFMVTGGTPGTVYNVMVRVIGQAEGRTYRDGMRMLTADVNPNGVNDLLYIGGRPGTARVDYNVMQLTIVPPAGGTAIAGAPTYYAFNAVDANHEGAHYNYAIDSTFTFKVQTGFTINLTSHDSNCIAIKNCGPGGPYGFASSSACEAVARTTPTNVTLPATFRGTTLVSPTRFQTQFLNFKVLGITPQ